jgi:hypothetical protein
MRLFNKASRQLWSRARADALSSSAPTSSLWKGLAFGAALAALWGFHAAAFSYPGRAYFHIVGLNDFSKGVGANVLLYPAFIFAGIFLAFRSRLGRAASRRGGRFGLALGLACWLVGATLSMLLNANASQVVLTYCAVFLAGTTIYVALDGMPLTPLALEVGLGGLVAGSLFPLLGGLQAFRQEWGVPDADTALSAFRNLARMELYEMATFGSRGNTAAFVLIVGPLLLWIALDRTKSRFLRAVCAATLIPVVLNLLILQIRAAFLTLLFSLAVIWGFKLGIRRYPLFLAGFGLAVMLFFNYSPDSALAMSDRFRPVLAVDMDEDASVMERAASIKEGIVIAERNWQFGIGPGGSLTRHSQTAAHQFQVQQFMEIGVLGLVGSSVFSIGVMLLLLKIMIRGQDGGANNTRFTLVIGPASFVMYGVLSNPTFNVGYVNTWTVLVLSMLALIPRFEPRAARSRARAAAAYLTRPTMKPATAGQSLRTVGVDR